MNDIKTTDFTGMRFVCAAPAPRALPPPGAPEIAFAGRSNAGKSSALNALCARARLARTSKTPGRTRAINFFASQNLCFADLPGYGFARVPPAVRTAWRTLIESYLGARGTLAGVVLVMDARRPLTAFDRQLLDWGAQFGLAFYLLLTKADKLSRSRQLDTRAAVEREIDWAGVQLFSVSKRQGIAEARVAIATLAARGTA